KAEERMADICFRPVQECTLGAGDEDVARVEVEMPKRVGDIKGRKDIEDVLNAFSEDRQFRSAEDSRWDLGLRVHQQLHRLHERLNQICERLSPEIMGPGCEDLFTVSDGFNLDLRWSRRCCFPECAFLCFIKVCSFRLLCKPAIPVRAFGHNWWNIVRE